MYKNIFTIVLITLISVSCAEKNVMDITISEPKSIHLETLPSASGIAIFDNHIFIVGDDSPWLYSSTSDYRITRSVKLSGIDSTVNGRVPKMIKADFECAELLDHDTSIVVVSSGSKTGSRDTAYILNLNNKTAPHRKNLRPLFEQIRKKSNLDTKNEINIEGLTFCSNYAYLLHRGNVSENIIIRLSLKETIDYLKNDVPVPDFEIFRFNLPVLNGVSSGFSGACMLPGNSGIVFSASMEDTGDEINDGKVLGSYIGVIPLTSMSEGKFTATLLTTNGVPLEKKIEGLSIKNRNEIISVCDNDDGTSDIILFEIEFY